MAGPLDLLEAERRPGFVDGDEGRRLVALLSRDLAQDVPLDPQRGGGQVGGAAGLISVWRGCVGCTGSVKILCRG